MLASFHKIVVINIATLGQTGTTPGQTGATPGQTGENRDRHQGEP